MRNNFPILRNYPQLIYFDSAATSLKPDSVIDEITHYYTHIGANIHRGIYDLSEKGTEAYELTRKAIASSLQCESDEIILTKGTTESMNLLSYTLGDEIIAEGDEVVVTMMEHHANFLPWQQLCKKKKAIFTVIPLNERGDIIDDYKKYISRRTKIFASTHVSNVLGIINPIEKIIKDVRSVNSEVITVIDGAQAVPHMAVDVNAIDADFYAFSAHKMCGPTGVGVLYGKKELLSKMHPFMFGGDMIMNVAVDDSSFQNPPYRFEAGTPHISGVIAYKKSFEYLSEIGYEKIMKHEKELGSHLSSLLHKQLGSKVTILGEYSKNERVGVAAMVIEGCHPHDLADILNDEHIAVRAGHHCAMPLHTFMKVPASTRASLYFYNTEEEVERFVKAFVKAVHILS